MQASEPPSLLRRIIAAPFFAGVTGGGAFLWLLILFVALHKTHVFSRFGADAGSAALVATLPALALAVALGYRTPPGSGVALLGRALGALFYGGLVAAALAFAVYAFDPRAHENDLLVSLMIAGAGAAGFSLHGVRGLWPATRGRRALVVAAGIGVAVLTPWSVSPGMQCSLGRAESCERAASERFDSGDPAEGVAYLERGCSFGGDPRLCVQAAGYHQRGAGVPRDLLRAESFSQRACAVGHAKGDDDACQALGLVELEDACDHYHALACEELARSYRRGTSGVWDPARSARLLRKACLLGDDAACP
jgi:TPR repeat protein